MSSKAQASKFATLVAKGQDGAVRNRIEAGQLAVALWQGSKSGPERKYAVRLCVDACLELGIPCSEALVLELMRVAVLAERFPRVAELRSTELLRPLVPLLKLDVAAGESALDVHKSVSQADVASLIDTVAGRTGEYEVNAVLRTTNRELRDRLTEAVRKMRNAKPVAKKTASVDVTAWVGKFASIPCNAQTDAIIDLLGMLTPEQLSEVRAAMDADAEVEPDTVVEPVAA